MTTIFIRVRSSAELSPVDLSQITPLFTPDVAGVLVAEENGFHAGIDTTVLASWLGPSTKLPVIVEASVSSSDPYNLARRVLSLQQTNKVPVALLLKPGVIDPLTESFQALGGQARVEHEQAHLWQEYVEVLRALWESFPLQALIADKASGTFSLPDLLPPIDFVGDTYRVAGPLNIPSDGQHLPEIWAEITEHSCASEISAAIHGADSLVLSNVQHLTPDHWDRLIERQQLGQLRVLRSLSSVELSTSENTGAAGHGDMAADAWVIEASALNLVEDIQRSTEAIQTYTASQRPKQGVVAHES